MASAFGRDDVDHVYTKLIKPTLRSLDVDAFRVDRVEHNEDIDNKLFELLDSADFCIADLTYARPSNTKLVNSNRPNGCDQSTAHAVLSPLIQSHLLFDLI